MNCEEGQYAKDPVHDTEDSNIFASSGETVLKVFQVLVKQLIPPYDYIIEYCGDGVCAIIACNITKEAADKLKFACQCIKEALAERSKRYGG